MNNDQLMQAVANLIKVNGRHHTEQAYKQLVEAYDAALTAAQSTSKIYTYASTQATTCAGCGKHKHTPLRIDAMGGYVCLTCIDQKLGSLLGEFGYPESAGKDEREAFMSDVQLHNAIAELEADNFPDGRDYTNENVLGYLREIARLRASLAKVEQEPVAWMIANDWGKEPLTTSNPQVVSAWRADGREVTPLVVPQAQQEAVKAAALLETIKEVRDHVVSVVRAFGEKACADYLDNWHKVEHIYAAMQASSAQADETQSKSQIKGCGTCRHRDDAPGGACETCFSNADSITQNRLQNWEPKADTQQSKKGEGK